MEAHPRPQRAKVFGDGLSRPLDRNAKAQIMAYARGWTARHRQPGQHIGPLTRVTLDVLRAILWDFHNAQTGRCFPSYEAIAAKAGCHRDSVRVAIKALEQAGILTWVHRLAIIRDRCINALGAIVWHPRVIRISNGYAFLAPQVLAPLPKREFPKTENPSGTFYQDNYDSFLPIERHPLDSAIPGEAALIALNQRLAARLG